ncbi:MAG: GNAT family N-acetyltransferase [Gemmatimonadaceae bacterium]
MRHQTLALGIISMGRAWRSTLIGRLAVNSAFEKGGYGRGILLNALERALLATSTVASAFVIVRAIGDDAAKFYMHYGFVPLPDDPRKLYLPMQTIEQLVAG